MPIEFAEESSYLQAGYSHKSGTLEVLKIPFNVNVSHSSTDELTLYLGPNPFKGSNAMLLCQGFVERSMSPTGAEIEVSISIGYEGDDAYGDQDFLVLDSVAVNSSSSKLSGGSGGGLDVTGFVFSSGDNPEFGSGLGNELKLHIVPQDVTASDYNLSGELIMSYHKV